MRLFVLYTFSITADFSKIIRNKTYQVIAYWQYTKLPKRNKYTSFNDLITSLKCTLNKLKIDSLTFWTSSLVTDLKGRIALESDQKTP